LIWLKIIGRKQLAGERVVSAAIRECDALIGTFVSSTRTADAASSF
jgi:hypothetical protein